MTQGVVASSVLNRTVISAVSFSRHSVDIFGSAPLARLRLAPTADAVGDRRESFREPKLTRGSRQAGTLRFLRRWRATWSARKTFINDWYGTSRSLARALSSSSSGTGRRIEIAAVDGRRSGKVGRTALLQSKYSAVSCFAQNRRSSSSFAKRGSDFRTALLALLIDPPLSSTHIPRRDDSDQSLSDRENHCEPTRHVGLSQGSVPWLALRVFDVWRHQEWAVEEHLLALSLGDLVQVPVLVGVAGVPLKTGALSQVIGKAGHVLCIC